MAKIKWLLKYGMKFFSPCHMNSVLVEAWDAFNMSACNIIKESFEKTMLLPLSPPDLTTNNQACADYIQVSSEAKAEEVNNISCQTIAPIKLKVTRTDDPMVVLWSNSMQQSSRNIILRAAAYGALRNRTVTPIQETKKECMNIPNQNKLRLVKNKTPMRNPDQSTVIYLTTAKVEQYRLVAKKRREKEEAKQETEKKTATWKLHIKQNWSEAFQKCQDSIKIILLSPTKELMLINLVNPSSTTTKDAFSHIGGNLDELPNQRRETVSREMIRLFLSRAYYVPLSSSSCHSYPLSSCHPSPH